VINPVSELPLISSSAISFDVVPGERREFKDTKTTPYIGLVILVGIFVLLLVCRN
jgi:hypothetical protein